MKAEAGWRLSNSPAWQGEPYQDQLPTVADAITISAVVGGIPLQALIDCSSRVDILTRSVAERCVRSFSSAKGRLLMKFANGQTDNNISIACPVEVCMSSAHGTLTERRPFYVADICHDVVLGSPWMKHWNASLCYSGPGVVIQTEGGPLLLPGLPTTRGQQEPVKVHQMAVACTKETKRREVAAAIEDDARTFSCCLVGVDEVRHELCDWDFSCVVVIAEPKTKMNAVAFPGMTALLEQYVDVFPDEVPPGLPPCYAAHTDIQLLPGEPSLHFPLRRMNPAELREVGPFIEEYSRRDKSGHRNHPLRPPCYW